MLLSYFKLLSWFTEYSLSFGINRTQLNVVILPIFSDRI